MESFKRVKLSADAGADKMAIETRNKGLKHLHLRSIELHKTLQKLQTELGRDLSGGASLSTQQVLESFGLIQAKVHSLFRQVSQAATPKLDDLVITPFSVPGPDPATRKFPDFQPEQVPELLRTKLTPELEANEQTLKRTAEDLAQDDGEDDEEEEAMQPWEELNDMEECLKELVEKVKKTRKEMKEGRDKRKPTNASKDGAALLAMCKAMNAPK